MKQILHIFQKDARRHWPEVLVSWVLLGLFTRRELHPWSKEQDVSSVAQFFLRERYIVPALLLFWSFLIVRVVQGEALVGDRQWWITKPYVWWKLLSAKIFFILIFIALPLVRVQTFLLHRGAYPVLPYLGNIFVFQLSLLIVLFLPSLLLGSLTRNLGQALLGAVSAFATLFAIAWLVNQIPSGDTFSVSPFIEHVENVLFLSCVTVVPVWQFAHRKRWTALSLLLGLLAAVGLIAALAPYGETVERNHPLVALRDAPAQIAIGALRKTEGGRVWPYANSEVSLGVPLRVSGVPAGTTVVVDALKIATDSTDGSRWTRGWSNDWTLIWPEDDQKTLRYRIDREKYEAIKTKPLHLHIELALSEYQEADARTLVLGEGVFFDEELGTCRINPLTASGIQCLKPVRAPAYEIRFDPTISECPLGEDDQKTRSNIVFHAWNRPSSADFPDPMISPISEYSLWFQPVVRLANSGVEPRLNLQPRFCPGAEVSFAKPVFKRSARIQFEIPDIRLQDLVEANWAL